MQRNGSDGGFAAAVMALVTGPAREAGQERHAFSGRYAGEPVDWQSARIQFAVGRECPDAVYGVIVDTEEYEDVARPFKLNRTCDA